MCYPAIMEAPIGEWAIPFLVLVIFAYSLESVKPVLISIKAKSTFGELL
jgi:hypothetical protein